MLKPSGRMLGNISGGESFKAFEFGIRIIQHDAYKTW